MERLDELARIGRFPGRDGSTRPGLGAAEQEACELVEGWLADEGLAVSWDGAGNLFGRLPGSDPACPETWTGSHLDTVPNGGRFDGALGVVCAIEAVGRLAGERGRSTVAVVVFRDEEGWRFGRGFLGSRAACGELTAAGLAFADADGISVTGALAALGHAGHAPGSPLPGTFIEVHVEQGPVLEGEDLPLAAVSSIVGMARFSCTFHGSAGHAGTVPMGARRDAFAACAEFAGLLRERSLAIAGSVATIGDVRIAEPAANVVPGRVQATVDVRAPTSEALAALVEATPALAREAAARHGCSSEVESSWQSEPVTLSATVAGALRNAAEELGVPLPALVSGAGHDAGILAAAGVDSGMLFVRSLNGGASHRPDELSGEADLAAAIDVLAAALRGAR